MKILKKGSVIYFQCHMCGCEFAVGKKGFDIGDAPHSADGNFYAECPWCGNDVHTDIARQTQYERQYEHD